MTLTNTRNIQTFFHLLNNLSYKTQIKDSMSDWIKIMAGSESL